MKQSRPETHDLQTIPGIGPSMAIDLVDIGITRLRGLVGRDPASMYETLRAMRGGYMDRCVLYVFRCAVYFAETERPEPYLLKWWHWKDRVHANERGAA